MPEKKHGKEKIKLNQSQKNKLVRRGFTKKLETTDVNLILEKILFIQTSITELLELLKNSNYYYWYYSLNILSKEFNKRFRNLKERLGHGK